MARTSIPCSDRTLEKLQRVRDDEYRSWDEFLKVLAELYEQQNTEVEKIDDRVAELEEAIGGVDSLAFNGQISDEKAQQIMHRLDDLEAQLPRKVAEELQ